MEKKNQFKVFISDRSRQMLADHILFLAQESPSAAHETKNELIKSINSLCTFPERFPFLNEEFIPQNKYHKMVVNKRYLIIYQIKDQTVYVDYILDCRQDYRWLLR